MSAQSSAVTFRRLHLLAHPSIWAAAAVPLPDKYLGEKICAAVVFSGPPRARPDVLAMDALPTTAVGKVDKNAIVKKLGS